ncbi:MAG: HD domain-containing phosphohydrolase [Desulfosporosinus sp.]
MRHLLIGSAKVGDVLGETILSDQGRVLVKRGVVLTDKIIARLKELGIIMVIIDDDISENVNLENDVISSLRRREAMMSLKESFVAQKEGRGLNIFNLKGVVKDIVDDILMKNNILSNLKDIRSYDTYIFAHAINVCSMSVVLGKALGLNRDKLDILAVGAILHDIGTIKLPQSILNKRKPFSPDELALFKTHTEEGYNILRARRDINFVSAHIAYQHHETFNGDGYPRKLTSEKFHPLAQIVALADFYDNLINEGPGHGCINPNEAVEISMANAGVLFSQELIEAFLKHIVVYPIGSTIELNSGDKGIVVCQNQGMPTRPIIQTLPRFLAADKKILNLADYLTLFITKVDNSKNDIADNAQIATINTNDDQNQNEESKVEEANLHTLSDETLKIIGTENINNLKHSKRIASFAFSSDGSKIVTASDDHTAIIWDVAIGKELVTL